MHYPLDVSGEISRRPTNQHIDYQTVRKITEGLCDLTKDANNRTPLLIMIFCGVDLFRVLESISKTQSAQVPSYSWSTDWKDGTQYESSRWRGASRTCLVRFGGKRRQDHIFDQRCGQGWCESFRLPRSVDSRVSVVRIYLCLSCSTATDW
jgi:hypothetical protein